MDNNLKKEFAPRDVQRMRNIITGNTGAATQLQSGWEKDKVAHKEGDVWEENGKQWTIKNGIKQTVTKLDEIKKLVLLPVSCPNCGQLMKVNDYNKKMWAIHSKCFDCVIKIESEIKRLGKWDEYVAEIMNKNKNAELTDLEIALDEWIVEKDTFVSEAGEVEKWGGGDKKAIYQQVKERIAELKKQDIYNQKDL
jgi:DNA-directed RNA polymerase subunit M/transcription elongation factor TFIIS